MYIIMYIILIIIGVACIISGIVIKILKNKKQAEKEADYKMWLSREGFTITKSCGFLLIDSTHGKWCKKYNLRIFSFNDIIKFEINKKTVSKNSSNYSGSGYHYTKNSRSSHGSRNSTSTTTDESTYAVNVQTNNLNCPLVVFECGKNYNYAQELYSILNIITTKKEETAGTEDA